MNPKYLWPVGCLGTLVAGWSMGYMMGGAPVSVEHAAPIAASPAQSAQKPEPDAKKISNSAFATEDNGRMQTILSALHDPDYLRRQRDIYDAILKMSPEELRSAVRVTLKLPEKEREILLESLVRRWATNDPRAAVDFVNSLDPLRQSYIVGVVASEWAQTDPRAAKEWALSLPDCNHRGNALWNITTAIVNKDPAAALQFVMAFTPTELSGISRSNLYSDVFGVWAVKDPMSAGTRALTLPPGQNRTQALQAVVSSCS